jgi:hypothetical protein
MTYIIKPLTYIKMNSNIVFAWRKENMSSKECVRAAIKHKQPDIVPADFACVKGILDKSKKILSIH